MALTDYSDMEKEIDEAQEPSILPAGSEVKARIIAVRSGLSEKNNNAQWYSPVFDIPSEPMVKEFSGFLWDLKDRNKLDPKTAGRCAADFKNFAQAFGLNYSKPFSWEDDLVGLSGWIILGVKKSDEYGDQNTVKKYVVGK